MPLPALPPGEGGWDPLWLLDDEERALRRLPAGEGGAALCVPRGELCTSEALSRNSLTERGELALPRWDPVDEAPAPCSSSPSILPEGYGGVCLVDCHVGMT